MLNRRARLKAARAQLEVPHRRPPSSPQESFDKMDPAKAKTLSSGRDSGLDASSIASPWAVTRDGAASGAHLIICVSKTSALEVVTAAPSGGFDALRAALLAAPDRVLYGAFPFASGAHTRFAFFAWVGPAVGGMSRAKVALQKGGVAKALEGCSADVHWMGEEDVTREAVGKALGALPGAGEVVLM